MVFFLKLSISKKKKKKKKFKKRYDKIDGTVLNSLSENEKKRQEIIFELIQTERDYVRDLDIIITVIIKFIWKKHNKIQFNFWKKKGFL